MFDQITIIGCGLIGSSIFKALKKKSSIKKIITFDNNKSVMEVIKKHNLSDEMVSSPAEAVKNYDTSEEKFIQYENEWKKAILSNINSAVGGIRGLSVINNDDTDSMILMWCPDGQSKGSIFRFILNR